MDVNTKEVCDVIIHQMSEIFGSFRIFSSFQIIDPNKFVTDIQMATSRHYFLCMTLKELSLNV
jgi:hypothetical protein